MSWKLALNVHNNTQIKISQGYWDVGAYMHVFIHSVKGELH